MNAGKAEAANAGATPATVNHLQINDRSQAINASSVSLYPPVSRVMRFFLETQSVLQGMSRKIPQKD
jgi:hypothetical protein